MLYMREAATVLTFLHDPIYLVHRIKLCIACYIEWTTKTRIQVLCFELSCWIIMTGDNGKKGGHITTIVFDIYKAVKGATRLGFVANNDGDRNENVAR